MTEIWNISLFGRTITDAILETSKLNESNNIDDLSLRIDNGILPNEENEESAYKSSSSSSCTSSVKLLTSNESLDLTQQDDNAINNQNECQKEESVTITQPKSNTTKSSNYNRATIQLENVLANSVRSTRNTNINYNSENYRANRLTFNQLVKHFSTTDYDPHLLVPPQIYGECEKDLCALEQQPFIIKVDSSIGFITDIHSHLCDAEIIGLLAGKWMAETKTLFIHAAFPCTATDRGDDGSTDVELDPEAEFKVREVIMSLDLQVR